jgi:sensor histidine kinase regulating citrate/malate metabolism
MCYITSVPSLDRSRKNALNKHRPKTTPKTVSKKKEDTSMVRLLAVIALLFFVSLIILSVKFVVLKHSWNSYAVQSLHSMDNRREMNSVEDATVVAMTVGQYPSAQPIYSQPKELQTYVTNFSKQTHRDLVVMDNNKKILADTVPANIGIGFGEDKNGEVAKTIFDGLQRTFTETSVDYPQGLEETVVVLKDASGKTVGAVVLSTSPIFN